MSAIPVCHKCGAPEVITRATVVVDMDRLDRIPMWNGRGKDGSYTDTTYTRHCSFDPSHDVTGEWLSAILAEREKMKASA